MILAMLIAILGLEAHAAIYIVGDSQFCNWDPAAGIQMTDNGDGTYNYTATISGIAYFVFADGLDSDWTTFNSQYRYGPGINDESVPENMWVNTQKTNSNGAYYVNFNWDPVKYEITFDEINKRFKIESEAIIPF